MSKRQVKNFGLVENFRHENDLRKTRFGKDSEEYLLPIADCRDGLKGMPSRGNDIEMN